MSVKSELNQSFSFRASDLQKIDYWSPFVCKIARNVDSHLGGTGFLVAPGVLMTCSHVIPDPATAKQYHAVFEAVSDPNRAAFDPDALFINSPTPGDQPIEEESAMDFTVVALKMEGLHDDVRHICETAKSVFEDRVIGSSYPEMEDISIIHYPALQGQAKDKIVGKNSISIEQRDALNLFHKISTEVGSSGAPIFNKKGELLGMHRGHAGTVNGYGTAVPIEQILVKLEADREKIENFVPSPPPSPKLHELSEVYWHFTNRKAELDKMVQKLEADRKVVLYGPGGVGKSELAMKFAHLYLSKYWLICTLPMESPRVMQTHYRRLALKLGVPVQKGDDIEDIISRVHDKFSEPQKRLWLIIYDDFDPTAKHLLDFKPPLTQLGDQSLGHIIFTSPVEHKDDMPTLEVEVFSPEHAAELILKITKEKPSDAVNDLVELCGNYPVTMSRAAIYIKKLETSIDVFLQKLPGKEKLLNLPSEKRYGKTLQEIINGIFLELPVRVKNWITLCSYMKATRIPISYLEEWLSFDTEKIDEVLRELFIHAIQKKEGEQLVIHQLFSNAFQAEENQDLVEELSNLLLTLMDFDFNTTENYQQVLTEAVQWKDLTAGFTQHITFETLSCEKQAKIFFLLGRISYRQLIFHEALNWHEKLLKIQEKIFGEDDLEVATSLYYIGVCYADLGEPLTAIERYNRAILIREDKIKSEDEFVARCLSSKGLSYRDLEKNDEAIDMHEKALKIRKDKLGEKHPDVAGSLNHLADCYRGLKDYNKALIYHKMAEAIWIDFYDSKHPHVALSIHNQGLCYRDKGDIATALDKFKEALLKRQDIYPETHRDIATSLDNIGVCYRRLGRSSDALKKHQEALSIRETIYGHKRDGHPDLALSLDHLGLCYQALNNMPMAKQNHEKAQAIWEKLYTENHPLRQKNASYVKLFEEKC